MKDIEIYTLAEMKGDIKPDYNEDTPFIKLETLQKRVAWLKNKIKNSQVDYANLDIIDKEEALKLIDQAFDDD